MFAFIRNIFQPVPHPHLWRRMTSEQDYANHRSPHWGNYGGMEQEICCACGITREVRGWQQWKYELDDAEKHVQYLRNTEPASTKGMGNEK